MSCLLMVLQRRTRIFSFQFLGDEELIEGEAYDLQIYARDLAGQVGISDADGGIDGVDGAQAEQDLIFEEDLMNPQASDFKIVTEVRNSSLDDEADKEFATVGFCGRWSGSAVDDYRE